MLTLICNVGADTSIYYYAGNRQDEAPSSPSPGDGRNGGQRTSLSNFAVSIGYSKTQAASTHLALSFKRNTLSTPFQHSRLPVIPEF